MEIHGKRPGAHQPFHQVALPVGELGVDGCRERSRFRLHRLTTPHPQQRAPEPPRDRGRDGTSYFCPPRPAITASYKTQLHNLDLPQGVGDEEAGGFCSGLPGGTAPLLLTPWGHQDLAVDGTPANGVDIHGSQIAPEVMAGVVFKAFIPEQHSVPWKEEKSQPQ